MATKTALQDEIKCLFHSAPAIRDISNCLKKAHDRRFPKNVNTLKISLLTLKTNDLISCEFVCVFLIVI